MPTRLIAALIALLWLQQPQTARVQFAFVMDDNPDYVAIYVQGSDGTQAKCLQVSQAAGETRCSADIRVPDTVRLQLLKPSCWPSGQFEGCRSLLSDPVDVSGGGPTGPPPGPFTVTFAGVLPPPPVGVSRMARQAVPTATYTYADNNALDLGPTSTLALWLQFANTTTFAMVLIKDGNFFVEQSGSNVNLVWTNDPTHPVFPNLAFGWSVAIPSTATWHHFAMVASGGQLQDLYVNGTSVGGPSFWGGGSYNLTNPLYIGSNNGSSPWNGAFAELGIWGSALSSGDITTLQTTKPSSVGSPIGYIDFDANANELIAGITPSVSGTWNTVAGPALSGGGAASFVPPSRRLIQVARR